VTPVGLTEASYNFSQQELNKSVLLELHDIRKAFGATQALDGVSLAVDRGQVLALIGENGAGKSTLMKIVSGAHQADSGTMTLEGNPYAPRGPRDARARGVAMIYQELALAPELTVEANVMLGNERVRAGWIDRREHRRIVSEALDLLEHPDIRPDSRVRDLGVGAQQLVEVARALVSNARVIVFDEPTSSLSERDAQRLFLIIDRLRERGLAIIYISHFLEEIDRVAERYSILRDGRTVAAGELAQISRQAIIGHMVGREMKELYPSQPRKRGEPILELSELCSPGTSRPTTLTLHRGEILGIAGLIGAGRTRLIRTIFGLEPIRSGRVTVSGLIADGKPTPRSRISQGLGFLSEDRKAEGLALNRSIEDNMTYSALARHSRWGCLQLNERRVEVKHWIDRLRIATAGPAQAVVNLSGGNQQKVALARLLHQKADVLLLDEPTRGIDVGSKAEIYRLLGELAAGGKAIIVVSSYLPELMGICDRIAVMTRGSLSTVKPVNDWTEQSVMEVATLGDGRT
jgi:ribose transport system ATP-binding protein